MTRRTVRPLSRLVLLGVLAVALAVAACGRKGALDRPPGAAPALDPNAPTAPGQTRPQRAQQLPGHSASDTGFDLEGNPLAAPAPPRRTILDPLID